MPNFESGPGQKFRAADGSGTETDPFVAESALAVVESGGPSKARIAAAATTNATVVKASAGQVYGWYLFNRAATELFVKIYDKASAPGAGDTPAFTITLPAAGGSNVAWPSGIPFANGIGYRIVTGVADNDNNAVAANDVHGVLLYK